VGREGSASRWRLTVKLSILVKVACLTWPGSLVLLCTQGCPINIIADQIGRRPHHVSTVRFVHVIYLRSTSSYILNKIEVNAGNSSDRLRLFMMAELLSCFRRRWTELTRWIFAPCRSFCNIVWLIRSKEATPRPLHPGAAISTAPQ
jgi:hypothetical protein